MNDREEAAVDREITHLEKEIERLESQLERFMEKGREAMIVMEASARTIDAYKAVVDAARKWQRSPVNRRDEADLHDALRDLDGEP